jgi:SAM-dependent methyltransferase
VEPNASTLARYSVALGARGLRRGPLRAALWRIWMPLDVDRVVELPWAGSSVLSARPRRVLDISSPKLLACWLADRGGVGEVVATDVWEREIEDWRRLTGGMAGLRLETADATRLPYEDASFDAAYSASVIEHIPGDGDALAMAELARVLRPGGVLALTFPYGREHADEFVEHDLYGERFTGTPLFFQRRYSAESVERRLLGGGGFTVLERGLWRKAAVKEAQGALRRIVPARLEIGRFLGPLLMLLGARALTDGPVDEPAADNVMRLLLRRV